MSAPVGNEFWKARSTHGRSPIFATPDDLWNACVEYFEWMEANPLYERKAFGSKDGIKTIDLPKMRAMSIVGLCIFLDISPKTWLEYRAREDYFPIVSRVDDVIRQQKFQGAAADLLNPSIIARDLGLANRSEVSGPDGGPIQSEITEIHLIAVPIPERDADGWPIKKGEGA